MNYALASIMRTFQTLLTAVSWLDAETSGAQMAASKCPHAEKCSCAKMVVPKWRRLYGGTQMSCFKVNVPSLT